MARPRPTLERTLRYMPVLPRANSKLAKEARRGSHDLRRLVGHANFLDTLIYELDVGSIEEQPVVEEAAAQSQTIHWKDLQIDAEWETEDSSDEDEEDEAITPEFDGEDDEDHALGRVQSHAPDRVVVHTVPVVTPELKAKRSVASIGEDETTDAVDLRDGAVLQIDEMEKDLFGQDEGGKKVVNAVKAG